MIYESSHWKKDLLKTATQLEQIIARRKPSEKLLVDVEKSVLLAAYVVRKLIEAKTISTERETLRIPLRSYSAVGKPVHLLNWHRIQDLYTLETPRDSDMLLRDVCNQLIHSFVFVPLTSSRTGPVKAVLFSSDRQRNRRLHELALDTFANVLREVGNDYPACAHYSFDTAKMDYDVRTWNPAD